MAAEGLVTIESAFSYRETLDRLKAEFEPRGLTLFAAIDHAKNAEEAWLTLRPSVVLVFGNAKTGTPLMQANQAAGIDLPLKTLVWEDAGGKTLVSYNDPVWIARRHGLTGEVFKIAEKMRTGLEALVGSAARS